MPKPRKGEKKKDYISRAIKYFRREGYSQREALGRAYGFWESYKKRKRKKRKRG